MHQQNNPSRLQKGTSWIVVGWATVSMGLVALSLARMNIDRTPLVEAGIGNLESLRSWWVASACSWVALSVMWWMLARRADGERRTGFVRNATIIMLLAVMARGYVIVTHTPALSDDIYRYIFDGRNLAHGYNPYLDTPAERAGFHTDALLERPLSVLMSESNSQSIDERWPGEAQLLPLINNPELHTIYLPGSQWVFAGAGKLVGERWSDPISSARLFRGVMVGFELLAIGMLFVLLKRAGKSAWWGALYAWHPLALSEIAGSGHQDAIGLALMMAAFLIYSMTPRRMWAWIGALALGTMVKPVLLPVAALMLKERSIETAAPPGPEIRSGWRFILIASCRSWKTWLLGGVAGGVICFALAGPLWLTHDLQPLENLKETSTRFSLKWSHFGSAYESTMWTIRKIQPIKDVEIEWRKKDWQEAMARIICLLLLTIVMALAFFSRLDTWATSRVVLFAMVLFSTTSHSWYVLWALILAPMAMSPALWIASVTLMWGYAQLGDVVDWKTPTWLMWAAYVPIYCALIFDIGGKLMVRKSGKLNTVTRQP